MMFFEKFFLELNRSSVAVGLCGNALKSSRKLRATYVGRFACKQTNKRNKNPSRARITPSDPRYIKKKKRALKKSRQFPTVHDAECALVPAASHPRKRPPRSSFDMKSTAARGIPTRVPPPPTLTPGPRAPPHQAPPNHGAPRVPGNHFPTGISTREKGGKNGENDPTATDVVFIGSNSNAYAGGTQRARRSPPECAGVFFFPLQFSGGSGHDTMAGGFG